MKKIYSLVLCLLLVVGNFNPATVLAAPKEVKETLIAVGSNLSEEDVQATKRLLGGEGVADSSILKMDGDLVNHYLPEVATNAEIYSSVLIQPMEKGYGVRVEIVTPEQITKVSSATYQNAAITSGAKDVLIRIASVREVTGEGALAGIYALLEKSGVSLDQKAVEASQKEIDIITDLKEKNQISDADMNRLIGELKQEITKRLQKKKELDKEQLKKLVEKYCKRYTITLTEEDLNKLLEWLALYATTDSAKDKNSIQQIEQSIMGDSWFEVLSGLDKVLTKEEILRLETKDFSDKKTYHEAINALYKAILEAIKKGDALASRDVYAHTFIIELLLESPSVKEKEALNYIRTLCYYYLASVEDESLAKEKKSDGLPYTTTKQNMLYMLTRYQYLDKSPNLKELLNLIAMLSGYAFEASLIESVEQKGDVIYIVFILSYVNGKADKVKISYDLSKDQCAILTGKKEKVLTGNPVAKKYKLKKTYQSTLKWETFKLTDLDIEILTGVGVLLPEEKAYRQVLKDYLDKLADPNFTGSGDYHPVQVLKGYHNGKLYASFYDLNHDGVEELIIGAPHESGNLYYAVYTFDGKQAINVFDNKIPFGVRPGLSMYQDGTLKVHWGSSAWLYSEMFYRINENKSGLDKVFEYTVEYERDSSAKEYIVGDYETSTERYNNEVDFWKKYADYRKYYSFEDNKVLDNKEEFAPIQLKEVTYDSLGIEDEQTLMNQAEQQAQKAETMLRVAAYSSQKELKFDSFSYYTTDKEPFTNIQFDEAKPEIVASVVSVDKLLDMFNTYNTATYQEKDMLKVLKGQQEWKEIDAVSTDWLTADNISTVVHPKPQLLYFTKDKTIVYVSPAMGVGPSPMVTFAPRDQWKIGNQQYTIPFSIGDDILGTVTLARNHKQYRGGFQRSTFYIQAVDFLSDVDVTEAKQTANTVFREGGLGYNAVVNNIGEDLQTNPELMDSGLRMYRYKTVDLADVTDYYHTYHDGVYSPDEVIAGIGDVTILDEKSSDYSAEELVMKFKDKRPDALFYFKKDHTFLVRMFAGGAPEQFVGSTSQWELKGDKIIIPGYANNGTGELVGKVHLKRNDKQYTGGRKNSVYYVAQVEK
ncbi:DUF1002 domain-containing protein [Streptococcus merionis]|uniref:DUF1002 domain-containing protein n=1 Tax=Streptococcus merionis TaxID=400065 RepID=UPI003517BAB9